MLSAQTIVPVVKKVLDTFSAWSGLPNNVCFGLLANCLIQRASNGGKIGCQLTDDC